MYPFINWKISRRSWPSRKYSRIYNCPVVQHASDFNGGLEKLLLMIPGIFRFSCLRILRFLGSFALTSLNYPELPFICHQVAYLSLIIHVSSFEVCVVEIFHNTSETSRKHCRIFCRVLKGVNSINFVLKSVGRCQWLPCSHCAILLMFSLTCQVRDFRKDSMSSKMLIFLTPYVNTSFVNFPTTELKLTGL